MVTIHLHDLQFFAYHGVYQAEAAIAAPYEVQLDVDYDEASFAVTDLAPTVNYVTLYNVVQQQMAIPTSLLETVAARIIQEIIRSYPFVKKITISIFKLQPPIARFIGKVGVTLFHKIND
jgi:7,8-dihydroneopterin aldolase/epimerase/oxygenase